MVGNAYKKFEANGFSVSKNTVTWTYRGADQKSLGDYTLILIENQGKDGMVTVDHVSAFTLVAHTYEEGGNTGSDIIIETIELESESALMPVTVGGGVSVETDPIFSASPAASITDEKIAEWDRKQDAIEDLDAIRAGASKAATAVEYVAQALTEEQKKQARANISAVSTEELQRMYNKLLALIQGGVVTPSYAILDQAILDQAVLS